MSSLSSRGHRSRSRKEKQINGKVKELVLLNLTITHEAAEWYKNELAIENQTALRFFVRYGGTGRIPGFSLGIKETEKPQEPFAEMVAGDILFYVEPNDAWYFDGKDLEIRLADCVNEPVFAYI